MHEKDQHTTITKTELETLEFALNEVEKMITNIKQKYYESTENRHLGVIPLEVLKTYISSTRYIINEVLENKA